MEEQYIYGIWAVRLLSKKSCFLNWTVDDIRGMDGFDTRSFLGQDFGLLLSLLYEFLCFSSIYLRKDTNSSAFFESVFAMDQGNAKTKEQANADIQLVISSSGSSTFATATLFPRLLPPLPSASRPLTGEHRIGDLLDPRNRLPGRDELDDVLEGRRIRRVVRLLRRVVARVTMSGSLSRLRLLSLRVHGWIASSRRIRC